MDNQSISGSTFVTARTEPYTPSLNDTIEADPMAASTAIPPVASPDRDLAIRTNALTMVDGYPVSKSVWPDEQATPTKPLANGFANGHVVDRKGTGNSVANGNGTPVPASPTAHMSSVPVFTTGSRISHVSTDSAASQATIMPQQAIPVVITSPDSSPNTSPSRGIPAVASGETPLNMPGGPMPPQRPELVSHPSRSYVSSPPPITTTYERPLEDPVQRRASTISSRSKKGSTGAAVAAGAVGGVAAGAGAAALASREMDKVSRPKELSRNSSKASRHGSLTEMLPPSPREPADQQHQPQTNGIMAAPVTSPESAIRSLDGYGDHPATHSELERGHARRKHKAAVAGAAGAATAAIVAGTVHASGDRDPIQRPQSAHAGSVARYSGDMPREASFDGERPHERDVQPRRPQSAAAGTFGNRRESGMSQASTLPDQYGRHVLSPRGSVRHGQRLPPIADAGDHADEYGKPNGHHVAYGAAAGVAAGAATGLAVGEVASLRRQHDMQRYPGDDGEDLRGTRLVDNGPVRRHSSYGGHRTQPADEYNNHGFAADNRNAMLGRSNTVLSRATTLGRNGTLSRAANGGTVGRRSGAFGRGAGLSVGTQPEEVLGREDIHSRAEYSERQLDDRTIKRLSGMEKRDAKRLSKLLKSEGRSQARTIDAAIKDLRGLVSLQKDAIGAERKSQSRLAKWTGREHKARMRFLKEKERYEKVEGELRGAENDFEERRDHAAGLTAQIAERTQEVDDLRAQKAADDREREVKLHALKHPAFS